MEYLAGLRLPVDYGPENNGFAAVRFEPRPPLGHQFEAGAPIEFVSAELATLHGTVKGGWHIDDDALHVELSLPPNTTGVIAMPDGIEHVVHPGTHTRSMSFDAGGDGIPTLTHQATNG